MECKITIPAIKNYGINKAGNIKNKYNNPTLHQTIQRIFLILSNILV